MSASPRNIVMVVEDDDDLRESMRDILRAEGYAVTTADNGLRALEILVHSEPQALPRCIVLDLMMPLMPGKTFIEILQRERPHDLAKIPLVIVTAATTAMLPATLPSTAKMLKKPMRLDDLLAAVAEYCEHSAR